jgi:hypothetical protein
MTTGCRQDELFISVPVIHDDERRDDALAAFRPR